MNLYANIYIYIHINIYIYIYIHMYPEISISISFYIYIDIDIYLYLYLYLYIYICVCSWVLSSVYVLNAWPMRLAETSKNPMNQQVLLAKKKLQRAREKEGSHGPKTSLRLFWVQDLRLLRMDSFMRFQVE